MYNQADEKSFFKNLLIDFDLEKRHRNKEGKTHKQMLGKKTPLAVTKREFSHNLSHKLQGVDVTL